jgi:hypothetical protein
VDVLVNYGEFPFRLGDGTELPPYGYRVKDESAGGHSFSGRVQTGLVSGTWRDSTSYRLQIGLPPTSASQFIPQSMENTGGSLP